MHERKTILGDIHGHGRHGEHLENAKDLPVLRPLPSLHDFESVLQSTHEPVPLRRGRDGRQPLHLIHDRPRPFDTVLHGGQVGGSHLCGNRTHVYEGPVGGAGEQSQGMRFDVSFPGDVENPVVHGFQRVDAVEGRA